MSIHKPASREDLKQYCLRRLGHPVIEINVDDDQVEDRIEEALQFYQQYHYDAIEQVYLKETITASTLAVTNVVGNFIPGETIVGTETKVVADVASGNLTVIRAFAGLASGNITGQQSGATADVISVSLGSFDNRYFDISEAVTGITRVIPFYNRSSSMNMFDIRYQIILNDLHSLMSTDLIYYTQTKQHLQLISELLVGKKPIRYSTHQGRLHLDMDWELSADIGTFVIIEATRILDPDQFTRVYNDMFLKKYTTALIKRQWGENLKKFEGVQLPGGVTLSGQNIFNEAMQEIDDLEQEMQMKWELPPDMQVG